MVLRNPILKNVFHRLDLIEKFETGIIRIKESYSNSKTKPQFLILDNAVKVILPIIKENIGLSDDEMIIYQALSKNINKSISEIMNNKTIFWNRFTKSYG